MKRIFLSVKTIDGTDTSKSVCTLAELLRFVDNLQWDATENVIALPHLGAAVEAIMDDTPVNVPSPEGDGGRK